MYLFICVLIAKWAVANLLDSPILFYVVLVYIFCCNSCSRRLFCSIRVSICVCCLSNCARSFSQCCISSIGSGVICDVLRDSMYEEFNISPLPVINHVMLSSGNFDVITSKRAGDVVRLIFDTNEFGNPHRISKRRTDISLDAINVRRRSFTNLSIRFVFAKMLCGKICFQCAQKRFCPSR